MEYGNIQAWGMLLCYDSLFNGVHAAHGRAVAHSTVPVPRTHALDECDFFGLDAVGYSFYMTAERPRSRQDALEFKGCDHIVVGTVSVFASCIRIDLLKARHYNN